mmetsp:Transcript_13591/g.25469  ORF Transcript_13591/g.25469 Transcript_13591/m.25469 type:complete len:226 (-) Transcript_13591:111-788(-)
MRYSGKGGASIRIVSAYRPNKSKGPHTVYSQQLNYFNKIGEVWEPRAAFFEDLGKEIETWKAAGDQVLFFANINKDVRDPAIVSFFKKLGMRELLLEHHGKDLPPSTIEGSKPIDGIWATRGIDIQSGGSLSHDKGPSSDHRVLWVKLTYTAAVGSLMPHKSRHPLRRLKLQDPCCVWRYNAKYKAAAKKAGIWLAAIKNELQATYPPSEECIKEYERIERIRQR